MAITIATLPYSQDKVIVREILKDVYSWFGRISILSGYKDKATIANFGFSTQILTALDCVEDSKDITLSAKEVNVEQFKYSIPVERCDLSRTWLSNFADKYRDEKDVFVESLYPFVLENIALDVRLKIMEAFITEAAADTDVAKVNIGASPIDEATAFGAVQAFIKGIPANSLATLYDRSWFEDDAILFVTPKTYSLLALHFDALGAEDYNIRIGGFTVKADPMLSGAEMYVTPMSNILAVFDDEADITDMKVVPKEWLNTDYLVGGIAVGGSYVNPNLVVLGIN